VHGLTRQGRDFDRLAGYLARRGYRVVCPDLPGRGRSDWLKNPDDYGLPQYCMDMAVLLARLQVNDVNWVGTSLGGLIGIVMAGMPQTPIRRLVVNDIGPYLSWAALSRIGAYLRQMPASFPDLRTAVDYYRNILAPFGELEEADWLHLTKYSVARADNGTYRALCDPGIAWAFRSSWLYNLSLWKYWDAVQCDVLLLRGEQSDMLSRETAAQMTRRRPRTLLKEVAGCGHAPPLLSHEELECVGQWIAAGESAA
jgi:pimeloyl-ACP methyl ester carboxylesterase